MAYQKLSYSGNKCNSYIYFAFDAAFFNPDFVTTELNLKATSVTIKKDSTSWKYRINAENDIDLEIYLEKLIDILEDKVQEITQLKKNLRLETRLQFVIDIDINPDSSTPYFGLNKRVISFLEKTGTVVDFDLYKADTIGLLSNLNKE